MAAQKAGETRERIVAYARAKGGREVPVEQVQSI